MSAAVFGLIGVIVGAFLSTALELATRAWTERNETTAVARLLASDLVALTSAIRAALQTGHVRMTDAEFQTTLASWREHRGFLARRLTRADWTDVAAAFEMARYLRDADGYELSDTMRDVLKTHEQFTSDANAVLARLGELGPRPVEAD